jgi:hypothetical protein
VKTPTFFLKFGENHNFIGATASDFAVVSFSKVLSSVQREGVLWDLVCYISGVARVVVLIPTVSTMLYLSILRLGGHVVPWCESHKPGLEGKGFPPLVVAIRLGAFGGEEGRGACSY